MIKAKTTSFAASVAVAILLSTQSIQAQTTEPTRANLIGRDANGDLVRSENAAGFGRQGQWTFSTDNSIQFSRRTQSHTAAVTNVSVDPAIDYFVIDNLSIGGLLGMDYQKAADARTLRFTLGPRVGYNVQFSRLLSLWPKIGVSYAHTKGKAGDDVTHKGNAAALNIFVPVMLHPAPHFFAGFGPFVDTDLSGNNRATVWGLKLTLGGWLNPSS